MRPSYSASGLEALQTYREDRRRKHIHATNFIPGSDKRITQACAAIGPIGRIVAEDALRSIQGAKKRKAQAG
jgi:hypothetical protein